jgi:addiction module HigA family antidote
MAGRKLFQNVPVPDPELMRLLEATAGQVKLKPIHPGEILREGFMAKFDLSPNKLALALCVAVAEVYEIVNERGGISAEMALRLGRFFHTTPEFWVNLQSHYDLAISKQEAGEKINRDVHPMEKTA